MTVHVLREARDDLRAAARYYRRVVPPVVGKALADQLIEAFKDAVRRAEAFGTSRPEHPDIPRARFVALGRFPYLLFYTVKGADLFVVSLEYATSDYITHVTKRLSVAP